MASSKREAYKAMILRRKIVELAEAGLSVSKIAAQAGCSVKHVTNVLAQERPRHGW